MFKPEAKIIEQDAIEIGTIFTENDLGALAGKKILVTGSTGLMGLYILAAVKHLSDKYGLGIRLYGSSRNVSAASQHFLKWMDGAGLDVVKFGEEHTCAPYDYIFHTASSTNPADLATRPLDVIQTNVHYTSDLLKLLTAKTGSFIFFSTREIYGKKVDPEKTFVGETDYGVLDPLDIRSAYPESKRLAENMVASFSMQSGNPYRIFRISHTYGPGIKLNDGRVLSDIIGAMVADAGIHLKSDGSHKISPTYVADVIAGVLTGLIRGENGCYNVSNHREIYSVLDIAKTAASNNAAIEVTHQASKHVSPLYLKHDTGILLSEKIQALGWDFKVSLSEGLRRVYEHYKVSA